MLSYRLFCQTAGALIAAMLWTSAAPACNVPVFRYALERWQADPYEIVVFHSAPLTQEQQALVEHMEKTSQDRLANLVVTRAGLAGELPQSLRALWNSLENPVSPWMVVRYPRQTGIERLAWSGPLNSETVGSLIESPARREIVQKLLSGESVVWLLLEGGDNASNREAKRLVEAELRRLEQSLKLPERSPLDPPVILDLPLKIAFSTVQITRASPAESMLASMLLNWNTNLMAATETMLFPIFGRGRVMPPAIGKEIRIEAIHEMAEFLTGPCPCIVKEMNPGYDLLLMAGWNSLASYQEVMIPEPPALISMSQFAAAASTNLDITSNRPAVSRAIARPAPEPVRRSRLVRNIMVVLGISALVLAALTLLLKTKASRRP